MAVWRSTVDAMATIVAARRTADEGEGFRRRLVAPDARQAFTAFVGKRQPEFPEVCG